jgi:two-component system response regulator QseB
MRLLLVEDDELLGDALKTGLMQFDYLVDWLKDGDIARQILKTESFDLIILDLGLPKLSGLALLQSIRKEGNITPVIILTALDSVHDRIKGLDCGADDYIAKPFDLNELTARIRALTRRSQGRADTEIIYKNIVLDPQSHTVTLDGALLSLARREFALLLKLVENNGQVLSRDQLMQSIYSWDDDVESNTLEVHIHNLRKKLNADYIRTVRGVVYMIEKEQN